MLIVPGRWVHLSAVLSAILASLAACPCLADDDTGADELNARIEALGRPEWALFGTIERRNIILAAGISEPKIAVVDSNEDTDGLLTWPPPICG